MYKKIVLILISLAIITFAAYFIGANVLNPSYGGPRRIILILLDALRADHLSCYGYHRETSPNMDRLAAGGVLFKNCFSQATVTIESIPQIFTSLYFPSFLEDSPHWWSLFKNPAPGETYLPNLLKQAGYYTASLTVHPFYTPESELAKLFDEYHFIREKNEKYYSEADVLVRETIKWIEKNKDKKYFLYLHFMDTHFPHYYREGYEHWLTNRLDEAKLYLKFDQERHEIGYYTVEEIQYLKDVLDMDIHYTDSYLARIFLTLRMLEQFDDTLIIITADHGDELGEYGAWGHGFSVVDEAIHVPLIISYPKLVQGGKVINSLVGTVDIMPTILDLCNINPPPDARIEGISLVDLMEKQSDAEMRQHILSWGKYYGLRDDRFKYVKGRKDNTDEEYFYDLAVGEIPQYDLKEKYPEKVHQFNKLLKRYLVLEKILEETGYCEADRPFRFPINQETLKPSDAFIVSDKPLPSMLHPSRGMTGDSVSQQELAQEQTDNYWSFIPGGELIYYPRYEHPPEISISGSSVNGRFVLKAMIVTEQNAEKTKPRDLFLVRAGDDSNQYNTITVPPKFGSNYWSLGTMEITNEWGNINIKPLRGTDSMVKIKFLELVPMDMDSNQPDTLDEERLDNLKGLGYLQ